MQHGRLEDRRYPCTECDAAFGRREHRDRHALAVHRGERRYPCTECDAAFGRREHRDRHARAVHHNDRRHGCPACPKAFARPEHLRRHLSDVHNLGEHRCDYCLGHRNSRNALHDDALGATVRVCNRCLRKATGTRIEARWAAYADAELGTRGLMGSDDSMRAMGGCSRKRPDRMYGGPELVEVDECDEHGHQGATCEQQRLSELYDEPAVCGRPMVVIRWNPHGRCRVSLKERLRLFVRLKRALRVQRRRCDPDTMPRIVVFYQFYPRDSPHICADLPHYFVDSDEEVDAAVAAACTPV